MVTVFLHAHTQLFSVYDKRVFSDGAGDYARPDSHTEMHKPFLLAVLYAILSGLSPDLAFR